MSEAFIGVDVGTGSARAGVFDRRRAVARERAAPDRDLARARRDRRTFLRRHLGADRRRGARGGRARRRGAGRRRRHRLRRDLFARRARSAPARSLPVGPSGDAESRRHRLDGPSRGRRGGRDQPRRPRGAALCRRRDLAGNAAAQAALARPPRAATPSPRAGHFLDLTDFLTFRATGSLARSACTRRLQMALSRARAALAAAISSQASGSARSASDGFARIGAEIVAPGDGARARARPPRRRDAMGLRPGVPVGAGLIDAHAGALGTLGGGARRRARRSAPPARADPRHFGLLHGGFRRGRASSPASGARISRR